MEEEIVYIRSGALVLEALLDKGGRNGAVVVTHPHPLYGGNMQNNVVAAIAEAYRREGYATLRFNFRGVGQSGGSYGEGIGEQQDVEAAVNYFLERELSCIDLAGYSFGAWVNATAMKRLAGVRRLVMVSPPVNFMDFSIVEHNAKIELVIAASNDDIAPPETIKKMLRTVNPQAALKIIADTDHFYRGKTGEIRELLHRFLTSENRTSDAPRATAGFTSDE